MTIAVVQTKLETTDDFTSDTTMVGTFDSAVTVGNGVVAVVMPEGNTVTGVTGCGTFAELAQQTGGGMTHLGAIATATTQAQTATLDDTTDFNGDVLWLGEFSGIKSPFAESGTSQFVDVGASQTTHATGVSITPTTENTLYLITASFNGNPGTITPSESGWVPISTGQATLYMAYKIVNGSTAAVSAQFTSGTARTSRILFSAVQGTASAVAITSINSGATYHNGNSVAVAGSGFGASQGTGRVVLSPTDDIDDVDAVEQTVTAWGASSITITVVRGDLDLETNLYLFVEANGGASNAAGFVTQISARAYIRETLIDLNGSAVTSLASIVMLVWRTGTGPSTGSPNPNEAFSVSTNGSGQIDQLITRGSLAINDPVWVAFFKNGTPARASARKVVPVYE
jgi:hypothetical protein